MFIWIIFMGLMAIVRPVCLLRCGEPKVCECRGYRIDCRGRNLVQIPTMGITQVNGHRLIDMRNNSLTSLLELHQLIQDQYLEQWKITVDGNPLTCQGVSPHLWSQLVGLHCVAPLTNPAVQIPIFTTRDPADTLDPTTGTTAMLGALDRVMPNDGDPTTTTVRAVQLEPAREPVTVHPFMYLYDDEEDEGDQDQWTIKEIIAIAIGVPVAVICVATLGVLVRLVKTKIIHL